MNAEQIAREGTDNNVDDKVEIAKKAVELSEAAWKQFWKERGITVKFGECE